MRPITLYNTDNSPLELIQMEPLRNVVNAEQIQDLLGQDVVKLEVESVEPVDFRINQRGTFFGKVYQINQLPAVEKRGRRNYLYTVTLEGPQYALRRSRFFNADVMGFNTTSDFSLTGDVELFVDVIINNLNRTFGSGVFVKGETPTTEAKTLSFNGENCLSALQNVCKDFGQEFELVQSGATTTIHIRKVGQVLGETYEYGYGFGLYNLKRLTVDTSDVITRLYAFGGKKNLRPNYRDYSPRLRMPDPGYVESTEAIAKYGVIEGEMTWDDIYPRRTGTITSVVDSVTFVDAGMPFDLFAKSGGDYIYLAPGSSAKISMKTGNLAGYEFEVMNYNHATKTFTIKPGGDEKGQVFPDPSTAAFQLAPGDTFVIIDIYMPVTYEESAELEVRSRALLYLDQNKSPKVQYSLTIDENHLKAQVPPETIVNFFAVGDYIQLKDTEMLIDAAARVSGMRRDILTPYKYILTISDSYQISVENQIVSAIKDLGKIVNMNDLRNPERARRGWITTMELLGMVFDTDGYFDGGKIRPESIETLMLVVGAKSQQFILQDVIISANFEGDPNVVDITAGHLIHYALKDTITTWDINATRVTLTDPGAYYVYAKVHKTNLSDGNIIFSQDKIMADEDPSYYHLQVGAIHSVIDGVRWVSLTYGATAINGRFLKTGRVQSFDGLTWFDLDLGVIAGRIKFIDSEGNYRDLSDIGAETDKFYELSITDDPDSYIDGKAVAWFQAADPAIWPSGEEALYEGDFWYNSFADLLWRREGGAWTPVVDAATLNAYRKQFKIRGNVAVNLFTAQPIAPYTEADLWMSEDGLRRAIKTKLTGAAFDPNDWVVPFNFDNTTTAIDGHIITSGIIQLAGDKYAIWAGMSGQGTDPHSVRFWAGASTENRDTAPWRVFQNGWMIGRTKIEVEGYNVPLGAYEGQAWLAGWDHEQGPDDGLRIGAGASYENRANALFQVYADGKMIARKGRIGGLTIEGSSLTNRDEDGNFNDQAMIVFRNDPESQFMAIGTNVMPGTSGISGMLRIENGKVDTSPGAIKYGAIIEASGNIGAGARNYALSTPNGISHHAEALLNGRRTLNHTFTAGAPGLLLNPGDYDHITVNMPNSGGPFAIQFDEIEFPGPRYVTSGKSILIHNRNDVNSNFYLQNTIRGRTMVQIEGGAALRVFYSFGYWYIESFYNNNW